MKRLLLPAAFAILAFPSFAAIQYEFHQKNTMPDAVTPISDLSARAIVEGNRSRVEFLSGNLYPPGTYVISDASRRLYFVDPSKQWFTEVNTPGIASALGAAKIDIANQQSSTELLDDRPMIAGYPTEHSRVTLSYDITVVMQDLPLKQHVETIIDTWTTREFEKVHDSPVSTGVLRTGNAELDRLFSSEVTKLEGFPLRQLVTIRTSYERPERSKLERPSTRTITREMWVTSIRETSADPSVFNVPVTYRRADQPELPSSDSKVLTFEPAGK
jgi:hypothetical protein